MGPFKTTPNGFKYVLTCIDFFTNWVEAAPLKTITADEVADQVFRMIIVRHGCPTNILTDRGTKFCSELFTSLCRKLNINKLFTSPLHPQTNGKVERFHRYLSTALSLIIKPDQSNWDEMLDYCLFAYRTTVNEILNETPFFLLYGRDALLPSDLLFRTKNNSPEERSVMDYKLELVKTLRKAYDDISVRRERYVNDYKLSYDSKQKKVQFNKGDLVMLYWPVPKKGYSLKLLPSWDGPYEIEAQLGPVTYRIRKGTKTQCVHVQRLKLFEPW